MRQLILPCGLKSQLAYIYMLFATSVMLMNANKSQVTFRVYVYIYVCNAFGHGGHPGEQVRVQNGIVPVTKLLNLYFDC